MTTLPLDEETWALPQSWLEEPLSEDSASADGMSERVRLSDRHAGVPASPRRRYGFEAIDEPAAR